MYPNLNAEMARRNIKAKEIADVLGMETTSVYPILSGDRKLTVSRALAIKRALFPNLSLEYLFAEDGEEGNR